MHHDWEDGRLLLVDKDVHDLYRHTGGDAMARAQFFAKGAVGTFFPRSMEAHEKGARMKDRVVAAGIDGTMNTVAGTGEAIEETGTWIGERLWNDFKGWLDGLGASGDKKTEAVRQIEMEE